MKKLDKVLAIVPVVHTGIGRSTAELFVKHGAQVLVLDIKKNMPSWINDDCSYYLSCDVSEEQSWKDVVQYLNDRSLTPSVLVNNAGISGNEIGPQTPDKMSLETWNKIHKVNTTSVFLACKHIVPLMNHKTKSCSIVNVASRSGMVGVPSLAAYASSKASVISYTKSLALYFALNKCNIRCNYVAPAAILTDMWKDIVNTPQDLEEIAYGVPMGRMGKSNEVAEAILYFASGDSSFTTGSGILIDGGILAGSASPPSGKK